MTSLITNEINSRLRASSTHLIVSLFIVSGFIALAISLWYPYQSITLTGVTKVFILLATIDIIIGPLLTFIVYRPEKKSLKLDLSVIFAIQLSAFFYGAYTVYQAHPVYITHTIDRFSLVSARDATPEKARYDEYKISKFGPPVLAYAESPTDPEQRNELMTSVLFQGALDLDARPEYYQPYKDNIDKITARSLPPGLLFSTPKDQEKLTPYLVKHTQDELAFLPLQGKAHSMVYVLEKKSALPLGVIDIDPWEKLTPKSTQLKDTQRTKNNSG